MHPFDLKTLLLARHAQHVVLIHFPIALFIVGVFFDLFACLAKRTGFQDAAYYNLLVAAFSTVPVLATGLLAWQLQLEGQRIKGILLLHLLFAMTSALFVWLATGIHFRARQLNATLPRYRFPIEFLGVACIVVTGHLGGFLSGVNVPG